MAYDLVNPFQESIEIQTHPKRGGVTKKYSGEKIRLSLSLETKNDLIVETYTDIYGKYQPIPLKYDEKQKIFYVDVLLKEQGLFKAGFRYRKKEEKYWHWTSKKEDFGEIHVMPSYLQKSIVYNAFIRFFGQDNPIKEDGTIDHGEVGTFDNLKQRLAELKSLGINILYLNPIHIIGELFKNYNPRDPMPWYLQPGCPYSIKDYKSIDPEIGIDIDHSQGPYSSLSDPMTEFKELVDEAHKKGIKVYMDLVFNHTSHDSVLQRLHPEWYLYKEDIKNVEEPFIYPRELKDGKPWGDPKHTFCPLDHGYWWEDAAQLNWEYMIPEASNDPPGNPTLNEMKEYFKSIPKYWIDKAGIDGFRCDVAYRLPLNYWKDLIKETHEFAKQKAKKDKKYHGTVVFIAESYVDLVPELLKAGFDSVYGDFSNKLYTPLTLKGYLDYMYNLSGDHFPEGSLFFTFPECHDFHRNTKKLLGSLGPDEILSERANQSRWLLTALLPGLPMIFNGFEKLEWHPVNLFSYSSIDWESDKDLVNFIRKVNKIRHKHKSFQNGKYYYLPLKEGLDEKTQIFSFIRKYEDESFLVFVNMDIYNTAMGTVHLPDFLEVSEEYELEDILTKQKYKRQGKDLFVKLNPGESHVFKLN